MPTQVVQLWNTVRVEMLEDALTDVKNCFCSGLVAIQIYRELLKLAPGMVLAYQDFASSSFVDLTFTSCQDSVTFLDLWSCQHEKVLLGLWPVPLFLVDKIDIMEHVQPVCGGQ